MPSCGRARHARRARHRLRGVAPRRPRSPRERSRRSATRSLDGPPRSDTGSTSRPRKAATAAASSSRRTSRRCVAKRRKREPKPRRGVPRSTTAQLRALCRLQYEGLRDSVLQCRPRAVEALRSPARRRSFELASDPRPTCSSATLQTTKTTRTSRRSHAGQTPTDTPGPSRATCCVVRTKTQGAGAAGTASARQAACRGGSSPSATRSTQGSRSRGGRLLAVKRGVQEGGVRGRRSSARRRASSAGRSSPVRLLRLQGHPGRAVQAAHARAVGRRDPRRAHGRARARRRQPLQHRLQGEVAGAHRVRRRVRHASMRA